MDSITPDQVTDLRRWLERTARSTHIPPLQYQPYFNKKGNYTKKGYRFGVKLRLKRKK